MTAFAASNARHAAATELPQRSDWDIVARIRLRRVRQAALEAGTWEGSQYEAIPEPARLVEDLHSIVMTRLYAAMKKIGEGEFNRGGGGGSSAVRGRKTEGKPLDWTVSASTGALRAIASRLDGLPAPSVRSTKRALHRMEAVHSIIRFARAEGESLREALTYRVPHYNDVLAARRADPEIATTHGNVNWSNGRSNSRRPLTPEKAAQWKCNELPAREIATAASEPIASRPSAPGPGGELAKATKEAPGGSVRQLARSGRTLVPPEVQAGLDELCGAFCGFSPSIVDNLRLTVARHGKTMPDSMIVEVCGWYVERVRDRKDRHLLHIKSSIAAFLRHVTADDHDTGGDNWKVAMRGVDHYEGRQKRAVQEAAKAELSAYEQSISVLQDLERRPADDFLLSSRDTLMRSFPEAFAKAHAAFEARRAQKGAPREGAVGAKPRTFADALNPAFVDDGEGGRGP